MKQEYYIVKTSMAYWNVYVYAVEWFPCLLVELLLQTAHTFRKRNYPRA